MTDLKTLLAAADAARDEVVELTRALVRIPSVNTGVMPTGDEAPAIELLREKLAAEGITAGVFESAPNRANLVARLEGNGSAKSLMLMGHVDVVPVEDEAQWTYPPFSAEIADGRIWGRGAADMKGAVAASTMAMILLKRAGVSLRGDLVLAAGADEETGGEYGFGWLAKHHPDAIRADYAINEGGGKPIKSQRCADLSDQSRREGAAGNRDHGQGPRLSRLRALDGRQRDLPRAAGARSDRRLPTGGVHGRRALRSPRVAPRYGARRSTPQTSMR